MRLFFLLLAFALPAVAQNKQIVVESAKLPLGELKVVPPTAHSSAIEEGALSPDGKYLATASLDGTARLWETATRRTWRVLQPPPVEGASSQPYITRVRWLRDGKRLLTGGSDRLCLWNVFDGKLFYQRVFAPGIDEDKERFDFDLETMALSRDEKHVLVADNSAFGSVKMCSVETGKDERDFGRVKALKGLSWADDEKTVLAASEEFEHNGIRRWNAATGDKLANVDFKLGSTLAISSDGKLLFARHWSNATLNEDHEGVLIETATGKELKIIPGGFSSAAFSPDNKWLIFAFNDKTMSALELATGRQMQPREEARGIIVEAAAEAAHDLFIDSIVFSPDGQFFVTSGERTARVWSWPDFREQATFTGYSLAPDLTVFSADGRLALTSTTDYVGAFINSSVRLWSVASGRTLRFFPCDKPIESLWLAPDGSYAFAGCRDEGKGDPQIVRWDLAGNSAPVSFLGHKSDIFSLVLSDDGKTLLSGSKDLTMRLWDAQTGKEIRSIPVDRRAEKVGFDTQGNAVCLLDNTLSIWDIQTGAKLGESDLRQQKWAALPDAVFRVPPGSTDAIFINGGKSVVQEAEILDGGSQTLIERDVQSGAIVRVFDPPLKTEMASWVSFSPDGTRALVRDETKRELNLWDVPNGRVLQTLPNTNNAVVKLLPGGKLFLSNGTDDVLHLCDLQTGRALLSYLTLKNGDWLAYLPDGRFDGSPGGMEKVYFQQGNQTFGVEQFAERFYQPGLVELTLNGAGLAPAPNAATVLAQGAPPLVKITSPQTGAAAGGEIEVTVEARAQNGGGIKAIRLYHNGRLVGGPANLRSIVVEAALPQNNANAQTQKFSVTLAPGDNVLRAVAYSQADLESAPDNVVLNWNAPPGAKPKLHILAIGVNAYRDATMNLAYARPDAEAMSAFFGANTGLFSEVKVTTLLDNDATGAAIKNALAQMAKNAAPDDVAVIYLAGHGDTAAPNLAGDKDDNAPQTFYFLPADAEGMTLKEQVRRGGLSGPTIDELVSKIPARRLWLIYDACKSGAALDGATRAGAGEQQALALLARAQGIYVLTAANGQQYANEVRALGHGILTYALLEGLKGKAADPAQTVRVRDLMTYTQDRVPALSREFRHRDQVPVIYGRGQNFPLVSK